MKQPQLISQGSLERMIQAAEFAWEQKDFHKSIEPLESASRMAPAQAGILLRLGQMHGLRYNYAAATQCFEKALRFAHSKTDMLTAIAEFSHLFSNLEIKQYYLEQAVNQPNTTPLACLRLAENYERLRRLPEATELVERALKLNPDYPAARLLHARLEWVAGRFDAAEQELRSIIDKPIPYVWTRAQVWYELGYVLDRREEYDDAMSAFLKAKSLLQAEARKKFGEVRVAPDDLTELQTHLSPALIQRWLDNRVALEPQHRLALLGGYPRSGTTLLEQVLDGHSDIVSAEETEVFNNDAWPALKRDLSVSTDRLTVMELADDDALQRARTAYFSSIESTLGTPIGNRVLVDKNPTLTSQIPGFLRIFPETRFLVMLRDPRDVVLSRFLLCQPALPKTIAFLSLEGTTEDYINTMNLWQTLAPMLAGHQLQIRYEDMVENLESVARKTLSFLDVPWDAKVLDFDEHARKKTVRSPTYSDVTQPVYKRARGRWRNYQKYLEPHLAKLEPLVKAFGYE